MSTVALSKTQRLRAIEKRIREAAETIQGNGLAIGRWLCEIRDNDLWEDESESWGEYLKDFADELVGKSFASTVHLIRAAEVYKKLPEGSVNGELGPSHYAELARLAPNVPRTDGGVEKDYSQLRAQDVKRVLKAAKEIAGDDSPTKQDIRKAVDADLGLDRAAKAKETKEQREAANHPELRRFIDDAAGEIIAMRQNLETVSRDYGQEAWTQFNEDNPTLIKRLIASCESLTELLKGTL